LELKERKEFKLEPLDLGVVEHKVLDGLLKKLKAEKKDFATVERGELLKFLRGVIAELIGMDSFIANFIHRSRYNTFIVGSASEVLEDCVLAIGEMVRAGIFRPEWSEISFGKGKELGEYKIGLSGGRVLALGGKIDRLDVAEVGGDKIAAVFDYKKRRDIPFGWTRFYYGLDMQLPIYLLAVRNASAAQYKVKDAAGAFYMPVEVSPKMGTFDELSTKEEDFDYKARGLFNGQFFKQLDSQARSGWNKFYNFRIIKEGDQYGNYSISGALRPGDFEKVLRFAEAKAIDLAEEIVSGKIDVKPYRLNTKSPCSYCKYKAVCRFDWQINDYNPLASQRKNEVLEKIGTKR
jgi:ATP-dependent helicase/nuclease subunit B